MRVIAILFSILLLWGCGPSGSLERDDLDRIIKIIEEIEKDKDEPAPSPAPIPVPTPDPQPEPVPPAPKPESPPQPPPTNVSWARTVDHGTNDAVAQYIETGNAWVSYNFAGANNNSYRYLSHQGRGVVRIGTARWVVKAVPYDGMYEVSTTWRASDNRTPDADYSVFVDNRKVFGRSYNQRGDGVKKVILGRFQAKKGQRLELVLDGTDDNHSDCADAAYFRLVPVSMGY